MRDVTLYSMKNKFVHNCRFIHHAKFHCNITMLFKVFKIDFERGKLEKSPNVLVCTKWKCKMPWSGSSDRDHETPFELAWLHNELAWQLWLAVDLCLELGSFSVGSHVPTLKENQLQTIANWFDRYNNHLFFFHLFRIFMILFKK